MACQVDGTELTKLVECNICLHSLVAPKILLCGHTFCKGCLDDLLKFDEDGSASIDCPMKCDKVTLIVKDETTESLLTNYSLTGILDLINKDGKCVGKRSKKLCQQTMECQKPTSHSCSQCSLKSCAQCWSSHLCNEGSYTTISFDNRSGEMQPLCLKHMSIASDVCIRCHDLFVCVYCTNRDHKNHEKKSIHEVGISTKNSFDCHIQSLQTAKLVFQKLSLTYDAAFKDIKNCRKTYVKEIEERKLYCLQEYLRFLNKMEKDLLNDFDENVANFKTEITSAGLMGFPNERNINSSNFLQELETKSPYEIIAESIKIEETFKELELLPISLPSIEISVDEMNSSLCLKEPFGKIGISRKKVNFDDLNCINIVKFHIKKLETLVNSVQLECNLKSCFMSTDITVDSDAEDTEDGEYSEKYLSTLIEQNYAETFWDVLIRRPYLAHKSLGNGCTLLLKATDCDRPSMVEMLLKHNIDVWGVNAYRNTAYHLAASNGREKILNILINHDHSRINQQNIFDDTPLHRACNQNNINCVRLLLSIPDINKGVLNFKGESPADLTKDEVIKHLLGGTTTNQISSTSTEQLSLLLLSKHGSSKTKTRKRKIRRESSEPATGKKHNR